MSKRKVVDFRVGSEIDTPDYWQGHGTAFTHYTDCATGNGGTLREALDDALESLAQGDIEVSEEQEQAMLSEIGPGLDVELPVYCPKCGNADNVSADTPEDTEAWEDIGSDYACTVCKLTFDASDTAEQYYYVSVDVTTDAGE